MRRLESDEAAAVTFPAPLAPDAELRERAICAGTVLLDARELAQRIGYRGKRGARTVREKVAAGVLPAVRIGKDIRFHWPTVVRSLGVNLNLALGTLANFFPL